MQHAIEASTDAILHTSTYQHMHLFTPMRGAHYSVLSEVSTFIFGMMFRKMKRVALKGQAQYHFLTNLLKKNCKIQGDALATKIGRTT